MRTSFCGGLWLATIVLAVVATKAGAQVITPVNATASSILNDGGGAHLATHAIIETGLDPVPANVLDKKHNSNSNANNGGAMWLSNEGALLPEDITFDLGAVYEVTDLHIWNYSQYNTCCGSFGGRGAKDVNIYYDVANPNPATFAEQVQFAQVVFPPGTPTTFVAGEGTSYDIPVATYALTTPIVARYIKFDVQNNWGGSDQYVGLSKVRFDGTLAVPEPTTALLSCIVIIGTALTHWRSRS